MKTITEREQVDHYRQLVREMTESEPGQTDQFNTDWLLHHVWKVVPVDDGAHFNPEQQARLIETFSQVGYREIFAVATEPLGDAPKCYRLEASEADLDEFNRECGMFRFMLTTEDRSWAISCNESYNLFAGPQELLETMLGTSIDRAWQAYWDFIKLPSIDPKGLLHRTATRYAAL